MTSPGASTSVCGTVAAWCGSVYSAMSSVRWTSRSSSARNGQYAPVEMRSFSVSCRSFGSTVTSCVNATAHHSQNLRALEKTVTRIGEPDCPVALLDHVVGRVEPRALPVVDHGLAAASSRVQPTDTTVLETGPLLAHQQAPSLVERHAIGHVGRLAHGRDVVCATRKLVALQL